MAEPVASDSRAKARDPDAFIADVKKWFAEDLEADKDNRDRALENAEFEADTGDGRGGDNGVWPPGVRAKREQDGRICLTINKSRTITRQVANELRLQPPAINVSPSEDGDVQVAQVIEGLIRSIEQQSKAKRIYAKAGEDAARGNMGFWRVVKEYVSPDSFDMELRIKPILNPMSVVFGPFQDSTARDARRCFVYEDIPKADFEEAHKGKATADFYAEGSHREDGEWIGRETVRVCEYWCVESKEETLYLLSDGSTRWASDKSPIIDPLVTVKQERKSERKTVKMYLCSGAEVLDEREWEGDRIPIVPVWGEEARIGPKRVRNGVLDFARDAIRLHTFARSANAETVAAQPKAPWLVTPKMVAGYESMWSNAANGNPAVLYFNADPSVPGGGRPERMPPPMPSSGWVQEALQSADDIKSTTGIFDASLGQKSNETSGVAIEARQREGDVGTYTFVDNVMDAIEETGRILIDMIRFVYDAPRQVRILGKKSEAKIVAINQAGGFDLSMGKYDVTVTTGNVTTQRQETTEALTGALQAAPMLAPVILPRLASLLDMPDADEFAEEVKQLIQPQQDGPQQEMQMQAMQLEMAEKGAGVQLKQAQAEKAMAEAQATGAPQGPETTSLDVQLQMAQIRKAQADAVKAEADAEKAQAEAQRARIGIASDHIAAESAAMDLDAKPTDQALAHATTEKALKEPPKVPGKPSR